MFECQGWGGGGSIKNGEKILPIQKWMLHECVKLKKYLPLGSQKFTHSYLGIHTDGLMCLNLWQMVAKIIEEYFSKS